MTDIWIPLAECKPRGVYRVRARNFTLAVFDGDETFVGSRVKFGEPYAFGEIHWDKGPPHGTCKPLTFVNMLPDGIEPTCDRTNETKLLAYLRELRKRFDGP